MKKSTINNILMGIIAALSISICILIVCISKRPHYVETNEAEPAVIKEAETHIFNETAFGGAIDSDISIPSSDASEDSDTNNAMMQGKTSTRVNVRDGATEDAKVLDTVNEGTTFEIIEVLDNGWTHVLYEGSDAYISSKYVIILNQ